MSYHRGSKRRRAGASPLAGDNAPQESGASPTVRPDRALATRVIRINKRTDSSLQDAGEASMTASGQKRTFSNLEGLGLND